MTPKPVAPTHLFEDDYSETAALLERTRKLAKRGELRGVLVLGMTHDGHQVMTAGSYDRSAFVFALEDAKLRLMWEAIREMKIETDPAPEDDGT